MEKVQSGVGTETTCKRPVNPKRLARIVDREMQRHVISSHSQGAMSLDLESRKKERTVRSREQSEALKEKNGAFASRRKKMNIEAEVSCNLGSPERASATGLLSIFDSRYENYSILPCLSKFISRAIILCRFHQAATVILYHPLSLYYA
ncbi:DUF2992 family protein [Paenibacillus thiaminolyticus]|uniref:DUF2992 family protein n=1 Tax=Paenibacillus thiaminolyticus TaxID=49283 RepID=UPI00217605A8|nr:DUF2992 family protein [Paenibacillus thiaminolyticus]